jgi:hypothetical protein
MNERDRAAMRIVFAGTIGRSGLGGQAWATLQYLAGLRGLGHEVWYLEDCGDTSYAYDWEKEEWTYEPDYPAAYVRACLEPFGLGGRWIYRTDARALGMGRKDFEEVCATADLLVMRAVPLWIWRGEYDLPRRRVFIDVDPGFTQISLANGDAGLAAGIARCERRFTVGQRLGAEDCQVPLVGGPWLKTLPPVSLEHWPVAPEQGSAFSSVIRWQGFREAVHAGVSYGQRDRAFPKYLDLPARTGEKFRIAMMGTERETLTRHGWEVVRGEKISRTPATYREFIRASRGEICIPKHGYVASRGGWFSDRSACYLASGRPVLMEDTGLSDWLPVGEGVVVFRNPDEAVAAIGEVARNEAMHRKAARRLAEDYFSAEKVLPRLLEDALN